MRIPKWLVVLGMIVFALCCFGAAAGNLLPWGEGVRMAMLLVVLAGVVGRFLAPYYVPRVRPLVRDKTP